jgi:transcriptional regulator with XRE-family HTH domain
MDTTLFGSALKEIRKRNGVTQEQLAAHLNVSKGNISRYESGKQLPELKRIEQMAARLGVEASMLMQYLQPAALGGGQVRMRATHHDPSQESGHAQAAYLPLDHHRSSALLSNALVILDQAIRTLPPSLHPEFTDTFGMWVKYGSAQFRLRILEILEASGPHLTAEEERKATIVDEAIRVSETFKVAEKVEAL